jgi:hypothetical protein
VRNLLEFPVTEQEVLEHLQRSQEVMAGRDGVGGMHAMIIHAVIELLESDRTALQRVAERLRV